MDINLNEFNTDYLYIISAIIILILVLFYFFMNNNNNSVNNISYTDKISIKNSLIPNSGRGVFAEKDFKKGEVIEVCPLITDYKKNFENSKIKDYTFKSKFKKDQEVIVFGMCSMYNHSDNFNVHHNQDSENMIFTASRDIKKGEELYVNYGGDYWNSRNN
uniref:SET domain-containing protein n=1 Tax=viral metagenome TaxID=1070528 RepID=A0A6C0C776_9ZZZZ